MEVFPERSNREGTGITEKIPATVTRHRFAASVANPIGPHQCAGCTITRMAHEGMERSMGLEPTPGPWQGPVLPLYYDRPKQENSSTSALRRQVPIGSDGKEDAAFTKATSASVASRTRIVNIPMSAHPCVWRSPDLQHTRCLNNGRLPLPFGKFGGLCAVGIYAGKPLTVFVKNGNLPMFVFAPFVFPELRAFSCNFCFSHGP